MKSCCMLCLNRSKPHVELSGATRKGVDVASERLLGLLEEDGLEFLEKCVLYGSILD